MPFSLKKLRFKLPTAFTIIMALILIVIIVSWALNGTVYSSTSDGKTIKSAVHAAGILDLFLAPVKGFENAMPIILFVLVIGGFIYVGVATKSLDAFAQRIPKWLKNHQIVLIPIFMIFFSILGTIEGFCEESLGYYLLLIPIMLMAGFDVFVGFMVILLGAGVGVMGSIFNPFAITVAFTSTNLFPAGTSPIGLGLVWRVIGWVTFTGAGIAFMTFYAWRIQKHPSRSVTFATYEVDRKFFLQHMLKPIPFTKRRKITAALFLFFLLLAIFYIIDWDQIFQTQTFNNFWAWIRAHVPYITSVLYKSGSPQIDAATPFLLIGALIIGLIHWRGEERFVGDLMKGIQDILPVGLIIATAAGLGYILDQTNLQGLIVNSISKINNLNFTAEIVVFFLIFIPLSFMIPSSSGLAKAVFPIIGPVLTKNHVSAGIAAFAWAIGWINLFTPTSGVIMGGLTLARTSYLTFWKGAWPIILILFFLALLLLVFGSLLPTGSTLF